MELTNNELTSLQLAVEFSIIKRGAADTGELLETSGPLFIFEEFKNAYQAFYEKASILSPSILATISQKVYIEILTKEFNQQN